MKYKHHKHRHHKSKKESEVNFKMSDAQEAQLAALEAQASRTPEEEAVRVALLELDERAEVKETADKALADAIAANPQPTPDPVAAAHQAVVDAQAAEDTAAKAYDVAEAARVAAVVPPVTPAV